MKVWVYLCVISLFHIPLSAFANWESFDIIEEEGTKTIRATYRHQDTLITIRSATDAFLYDYFYLAHRQPVEYVPFHLTRYFFEKCNLARQKQGQPYHLFFLSCDEKDFGFIHLGRKKTYAVKKKTGWSEYKETDKENVLELWKNLGIIRENHQPNKINGYKYERIDSRGIARMLPVLIPDLSDGDIQIVLEVGFQLICRLATKGFRLLPEQMVSEQKEEETIPYQVVAELAKDDPNEVLFRASGFKTYQNPCKDNPTYNEGNWMVRCVE